MFDYTGYGENILTFKCTEDTKVGDLVCITDNDTVSPAAEGDIFCGVAATVRQGVASVITGGFVRTKFSGEAPAFNIATIACDGEGGVKAASGGRAVTVITVDTDKNTVGFIF